MLLRHINEQARLENAFMMIIDDGIETNFQNEDVGCFVPLPFVVEFYS